MSSMIRAGVVNPRCAIALASCSIGSVRGSSIVSENREPGTKNQEPGTRNREPRTRNQEPRLVLIARFAEDGAVEQNGDRTIVHQCDTHHRAETSGADRNPQTAQFVGEDINQRRGDLRRCSIRKTGAPPTPRVGVERKLRYDQRLAANIEQRSG
jgi:hypothetical protein